MSLTGPSISLVEFNGGKLLHDEILHVWRVGQLDHLQDWHDIFIANVVQAYAVRGVVVHGPRENLPDLMQLTGQGQACRLDFILLHDHAVAHVEEAVVDPLVVQLEVQREQALFQETGLAEMAVQRLDVFRLTC